MTINLQRTNGRIVPRVAADGRERVFKIVDFAKNEIEWFLNNNQFKTANEAKAAIINEYGAYTDIANADFFKMTYCAKIKNFKRTSI